MPEQKGILETIDERLYQMQGTVSAIKQSVDDLIRRLYNGGSGAIPVLFTKVDLLQEDLATKATALKQATEDKALVLKTHTDETAKDLQNQINALKLKRAFREGWVAGAGALLALAAKLALNKLGWHF